MHVISSAVSDVAEGLCVILAQKRHFINQFINYLYLSDRIGKNLGKQLVLNIRQKSFYTEISGFRATILQSNAAVFTICLELRHIFKKW